MKFLKLTYDRGGRFTIDGDRIEAMRQDEAKGSTKLWIQGREEILYVTEPVDVILALLGQAEIGAEHGTSSGKNRQPDSRT
jgi:hypothetical protein